MGKCMSASRGGVSQTPSKLSQNSTVICSGQHHTDSSNCQSAVENCAESGAYGINMTGKYKCHCKSQKQSRTFFKSGKCHRDSTEAAETTLQQNGSNCCACECHRNRRAKNNNSSSVSAPSSVEQQELIFQRFSDANDSDKAITDEGVARLCTELGWSPVDVKILIFAWKCDAVNMCRFTKQQWLQGSLELGSVSTIEELRFALEDASAAVAAEPSLFRQLYCWTFRFGLESGQKSLSLDTAIGLWQVIFSLREPSLLKRWLSFLGQDPPPTRGISRDTWDMFLKFLEVVGDDLTLYNDAEAWPTLIDDFVEHESDCANQNRQMLSIDDSATQGAN